jgi:hypothetical protein
MPARVAPPQLDIRGQMRAAGKADKHFRAGSRLLAAPASRMTATCPTGSLRHRFFSSESQA